MADDNLPQRLDRIETALSALATKADLAGLATKADLDRLEAELTRLVTKTEGIESELTKNDERHAELLAAIRDLSDHDADATALALQHQLQRLERRVEALEKKAGG
jgi:hypothetical protein